ncbi:MAG: right-handed parallel beta-helix repeat-containing protein [Planctomycetota bacterium]|jgi:hypothetical protein
MVDRTYLKAALSISIFFMIAGWAGAAAETIYLDAADGPYASNPTPSDGDVIEGSPLGDDIYTTLDFIPGATAVKHTGYFSDDYAEVSGRAQDANLGDPPYGGYRYYVGLYAVPPATESLVQGRTYYWTVDETDANGVLWQGPVWSFSILSEKAWSPDPPDGQKLVSITPILSWKAGLKAQWHVIYFGTSFDDVNDSIIEPLIPPPLSYRGWQPVGDEEWDPIADGGLTIEFETTYYWRIDEGQEGRLPPPIGGGTVIKGDVWCFTTEPEGLGTIRMDLWWNMSCPPPCHLHYIVNQYPPDETRMLTSFNSGIELGYDYVGMIYGWLHPAKSGDYRFWICTDDNSELYLSTDERTTNMQLIAEESSWANPFTWNNDENMSALIPLIGGRKYYIMALWRESSGGDHCMVAWQGPDQPLEPVDGEDFAIIHGSRLSPFVQYWAHEPDPCDGETDVALPVNLRWEPGDNAAQHNVYIGTEFNAVKNAYYDPRYPPPPAVFLATTTEPNILVPGLAHGVEYYWRIDEFPPPVPPLPYPSGPYYKGDVWSFTTEAQRIYVDMDAAGANDGTSWEDAYNYLQDALSEARAAPTPVEIHVAQGIYTPDCNSSSPTGTGNRRSSFGIVNKTSLKGGYAGASAPDPNARNIELYETVLSGDLNGDDSPDFANNGENSYHVVTGSGNYSMETTIIDGFTITGGYANGPESFDKEGAGIKFYVDCGFRITNCTIIGNKAESFGGGMYSVGNGGHGSTIINCRFISNTSNGRGGGLCLEAESIPHIINCIISRNEAVDGGAIYVSEGYPRIINSTISRNIALDQCGGAAVFEGCLIFSNCILWANLDSGYNDEAAQIQGQYVWVDYSCVQGWTGDLGGIGNIGDNPLFAEPDFLTGNDYHLTSQAGRWDANSEMWVLDDITSPCIDAGNPGCPLGDEPLPNGNRRNMGAYGGTAEASKSPANWRSIADMTNDWTVDSDDLRVYVDYWLESGECIPGDLNRSQFVDFNDFAIFGSKWQEKGPGPGITYEVDNCIPWEPGSSMAIEPNQTRFSVRVEGNNIHFEDLITANCCADRIELQMTVEGNLITIYEIEQLVGVPCPCICDYPVTATLGPFEEGTYLVEVIGINGSSLGVVEVTIGGPGMTFHIDDCNMEAGQKWTAAAESNEPRFSVWVEGNYIYFEDQMYANCCPDELGLDKEINGNEITLYEIGYGGMCDCMCYFPITATLGPFEDGTYTVEVYDNYGNSLGVVEVTIGGPGITYQIEDCNQQASGLFSAEPPDQTRFTVTVEGRYIHFEDMMIANCCPDELGLEMTVEDSIITIYETEYTPGGCYCICDYPVTATLGPFEDGTYTIEVFDNYGQLLGVVEVTIGGLGITYQIEDCNRQASGLFAAIESGQTRFTVTVDGRYIHFEDTMVANCCPDELGLEMTVEDNLITIYETEYTPYGCRCMCNYPITATLGPFEPGTYTLEVYEDHSGFIGSTIVVVDPPP